MTEPFSAAYAGAYDAFYRDKDYAAECDLVEEAFRRHAPEVKTVLDFGCGTGGHALLLADRGYAVTGVDLSEEMLEQARAKDSGQRLTLIQGDVRSADPGGPFDAVLLMFAVLGYQQSNEDVSATLANARRQLEPGGLLVLDAWYGPGVLTDPPGEREIEVDGITRLARAELDVRGHLCRVRYELSGDGVDEEETHTVRFFFPMELELYLANAGFELLSLTPFGTLDGEPDERTWNVTVVARASGSNPAA